MILKILRRIFAGRRFWRNAPMSEVAEIYLSRMLRIMALNMMGIFIAIFLYQNGLSVAQIAFVWAGLYFFKALIGLPLATVVAWIGPKHATLVANILYIPVMVIFALIPEHGPWLVLPAFVIQGVSTVLYGISHSVNFSKVKSLTSAGKEIAVMNIIEKVAAGIAPIVGGFVAFIFGPEVVIVVSAILFLMAAVPLFRTGEHVSTRKVLKFRGFPWRVFFSQAASHYAYGIDVFASGTAWSLYFAIFIIGVSGNNEVYAITGVLTSVVFVVAITSSYLYGRLVDKRHGWLLYRIGAVGSVIIHGIRPFISSTVTVAGLNVAREAASTAYMLPYTRATFDTADVTGARSTYIGLVDVVMNIGAASAAATLGLLAMTLSGALPFHIFFFIAGGGMLLLLAARFPMYRS